MLAVVCGLPVSVGGVAGLCRDTSQALEKPDAEIAERVRAEPVVNVDGTSWRQARTKSWLWVMGGKQATLMRALKRRNSECLGQLLGADYSGTVISGRFSAYKCLPVERRAICWSHLKRDFQSFADWGGATGVCGKRMLEIEQAVFRDWYRFRDGQLDRAGLLEALVPTQEQTRALLSEGLKLPVAEGFCQDLLKL